MLSVDSSSELVLVDVLGELVEIVLVDGPCELVIDRICPPVVSPPLAPDWRLVATPEDAKDCRDCEKSTWVSCKRNVSCT